MWRPGSGVHGGEERWGGLKVNGQVGENRVFGGQRGRRMLVAKFDGRIVERVRVKSRDRLRLTGDFKDWLMGLMPYFGGGDKACVLFNFGDGTMVVYRV